MAINIRPITAALGAEVEGVNLASRLNDETMLAIRQALLKYLVIFFRDQTLDPANQLAFARRFGDPIEYPFAKPLEGFPFIVPIIKREHETLNFGGIWHSDTTYLERPPLGTILYARQVPPVGGDTLFANMYLAFDSLSDGMQQLLGRLVGVNRADKLDASRTQIQKVRDPTDSGVQVAEHPVVRLHPETSRKSLYINVAHTTNFRGLTESESTPLLDYLFQQQTRPEFCCRFRWEEGSLAFWDNRCTLHNPVNDYHGHRREMHRITLAGEVPMPG